MRGVIMKERLGDLLKRLRKEAGLSREELAVRANTTIWALHLYECCKVNPSLGMVKQLFGVFGVSFALLDGCDFLVDKRIGTPRKWRKRD
jgi:transcriptional regulator with XRE-family HTH domain